MLPSSGWINWGSEQWGESQNTPLITIGETETQACGFQSPALSTTTYIFLCIFWILFLSQCNNTWYTLIYHLFSIGRYLPLSVVSFIGCLVFCFNRHRHFFLAPSRCVFVFRWLFFFAFASNITCHFILSHSFKIISNYPRALMQYLLLLCIQAGHIEKKYFCAMLLSKARPTP